MIPMIILKIYVFSSLIGLIVEIIMGDHPVFVAHHIFGGEKRNEIASTFAVTLYSTLARGEKVSSRG